MFSEARLSVGITFISNIESQIMHINLAEPEITFSTIKYMQLFESLLRSFFISFGKFQVVKKLTPVEVAVSACQQEMDTSLYPAARVFLKYTLIETLFEKADEHIPAVEI